MSGGATASKPVGNTLAGMIQSFKGERARELMEGLRVVELMNLEEQARTRLIRLDATSQPVLC